MANQEVLQIGTSIDIKRTDGRIHSAYVAAIHYEEKTATVEWIENGETKGKQIDMDSILALNPDLAIRIGQLDDVGTNGAVGVSTPFIDEQIVSAPVSALPVAATRSSRLTARGIEGVTTRAGTSKNVDWMRATPVVVSSAAKKIKRELSGSSDEDNGTMAQSVRFNKLNGSDDEFNPQLSPDTATLSNPTLPVLDSASVNKATNGSTHSVRTTQIPQLNNNDDDDDDDDAYGNEFVNQVTTSRSSNAIVQNSRRSNVLKEVERLKKNREERRQRQADEKATKEANLQSAPGGNLHWEFQQMIQEYRRNLNMNPLTDGDPIEDHLITVCVRKRPLNKKENDIKEVDVVTIPSKNQLVVHEPKSKVDLTRYMENQIFRFDYAFDETCSNYIVYKYTAQPLVKTVFEGGFSTCFAYGQTGSGKTHTMGGTFHGKKQDCDKGIYAFVAADVFKLNASAKYRGLKLNVYTSFFEIYSGKVFDLLNNKARLRVLEDGKQQVQVVGLTERMVNNVEDVLKVIQKGNSARTSGQTSANSNSSRSHAIFQFQLKTAGTSPAIHGKFSLIDLAGNERGADTSSANRTTRMEGAEINKSLLALKECIRALGRKGAHLPFRVSNLTQVLRDSFVGNNARTCMIAMISPGVSSCEHSLNTLRYADRVKELGGGDVQTVQVGTVEEETKNGDADLTQLRSLNKNDMTPELLNFHQIVSEMQIAEENMLETQKETHNCLTKAAVKAGKLLKLADKVTYDQEGYCNSWKQLIDSTRVALDLTEIALADYQNKMVAEEQLSRQTLLK